MAPNNFTFMCVCVLYLVQWVVTTNFTNKFPSMDINELRHQKLSHSYGTGRQQRFITFDSKEGDVNVELAFNVPFLRIPIRDAMENFKKGAPLLNINVGAVILAGALSFGAITLIPGLLGLFHYKGPEEKRFRAHENSGWWRVIATIEEILIENNIDSTTCMQRGLCWMVKNSSRKVSTGNSVSSDKIIDGIASNSWVHELIKNTAVKEAIDAGYKGHNCATRYSSCKLTDLSLQMFLNRFNTFQKDNE